MNKNINNGKPIDQVYLNKLKKAARTYVLFDIDIFHDSLVKFMLQKSYIYISEEQELAYFGLIYQRLYVANFKRTSRMVRLLPEGYINI